MFDTAILEEALKQDLLQTPYFKTLIDLRNVLAEELKPHLDGWLPDLDVLPYTRKIASSVVARMNIDVNDRFVKSEKYEHTLDLMAKLIAKMYADLRDEGFDEESFLCLAKTFELTSTV